uniref:NADH-ubiquinone oxidoreductase chain 4 n=1 Tax=Planopleura kaempferi TaxID=3381683 RepID=A0A343J8E8_9HEMI|nr:NADH dehydrogenase subunit 4 [Platypleura kaempferi]
MLKLIFMCFFMIPLMLNFWLMSNMMLLSIMTFILLFNKDIMYIGYMMQLDLFSYGLIILSIWISLLMIMSSPKYKNINHNIFMFLILMLMNFLILSFSSSSLIFFYIFFEMSLIPTLMIIIGWGYQPERIAASYYLIFYTLTASFPMLLSIFFLNNMNFTMVMNLMIMVNNMMIYLGMIMAFLVKMPLFMFHFWLPKAHVEAPISGSMILAGVLLKLGGYGLIRVMFIMPLMYMINSYIWISISMFGMIMVSMMCMVQVDLKSMIAYSSVVHMGLVVGGIMTINYWGVMGSYYMMIGHGLCSSGLFCLANISYERLMSRSILINKGMMTFMPSMSLMWFIMCASNMSCPPTINLVGEIMIINSLMSWNSVSMMFLMLTSFLSACYSLYLFSFTQHGQFYSGMYSFDSGNVREFMLVILHWIPLNFIILKLNIMI